MRANNLVSSSIRWLQANVRGRPLTTSSTHTIQCNNTGAETSILLSKLKACSSSKDLRNGKKLHAEAARRGQDSNLFVANCLISMYAKCGSLIDARSVFDKMSKLDVVSWNSFILGCAENGEAELALRLFSIMVSEGCARNARSYVAALKACTSLATQESGIQLEGKLVKVASLDKGSAIHSQAVKCGLDANLYVANALINMYAKCGNLVDARRVFETMLDRDVVSWTSLLLGYAENGEAELALEIFEAMQQNGCQPDHLALVAALNACNSLAEREQARKVDDRLVKVESLEKVMAVHFQAVRTGHESNILVGNSLIDSYAKCGSLGDSRRVFDRMRYHTVVSWTVLMLGYAANGQGKLALDLLTCMRDEGCSADVVTYFAAINACSSLADNENGKLLDGKLVKLQSLESGMVVHSQAAQSGYDSSIFVANALMELYFKCGSSADAERAFGKIKQPDIISWNALMAGYAESGQPELALDLFAYMRSSRGFERNFGTLLAALRACKGAVLLADTKAVHADICRRSFLKQYLDLAKFLVDIYAKCGSIADAQRTFDSLASWDDPVTWTSLIAAYSRQGAVQQVIELFHQMQDEGLTPDGVTFICLLSACSHAGLVDQGKSYFQAMSSSKYKTTPGIEHYHCMIDMLARANRLDEAVRMVQEMPYKATGRTWTIVLAACDKWKNLSLARLAFESLVKVDETDPAAYLLMANIYRHQQLEEDSSENDSRLIMEKL